YIKAAERGNQHAPSALRKLAEEGILSAYKGLKRQAENNNATAQFNLGEMYANGQDINKNKEEAVRWYIKAAEKKKEKASSVFDALIQLAKEGIPLAREWVEKQAENGNATAQFTLGNMYANEQGVDKNVEKAAEWYIKA